MSSLAFTVKFEKETTDLDIWSGKFLDLMNHMYYKLITEPNKKLVQTVLLV